MAEDKLGEIAATLKELLKWTKFSGMKEVRNVLLSALNSDEKKSVYELSNGKRSTREIAGAANVNEKTVRNYWKSWSKIGIVEGFKAGTGERFKKSFDLEDFGIEIPKTNPSKSELKERKGSLSTENSK